MPRIVVTRDDSPLVRRTWRFYYDDGAHRLYVTGYERSERPTVRHKHRPAVSVEHTQHAYEGVVGVVPPDVLEEARAAFCATLTVGVGGSPRKR